MIPFALLLLLFVFTPPVPLHAEIEVLHDHFSGRATVRTKPKAPTTRRPSIALLGSHSAEGQPGVVLMVVSTTKSWRYLQCHHTDWFADNKSLRLPQPTHKAQIGPGFVIETLMIAPVTIEQIEQLAQAKKVEFRVCNDEYEATAEEMTDLHVFLSKMRDPAIWKSP
jgi:hypothetical protein